MNPITIDISFLSSLIGSLTAIAAPAIWLYKTVQSMKTAVNESITAVDKRCTAIDERVEALESWTRKQQQDIESGKEERQVLILGVLACLKGLKEQGCNGPVTKTINDIENYLVKESHKGKSELR